MKLYLLKDDGTLYEIAEDVEEYDLTKPMPRMELIEEIKEAIEAARSEA